MLRRRTETQAGRVLADLYRERATPTYRFALHFTGSQADAEDLLQTAFLEAHRVLLRGDELVNPRAWLARVVRTRALNLRRDRHDIPIGDDIDAAAGGVDPIESHEELRRVRAMLWGLPEAQHQAFVMRHWSGLSNREIAEVLDTTETAVESLLVRARRALLAAEALAPACVEFRTRLADGLPETPAMRQHRHTCRSCTAAGQRLAGAAAIAGVLLLAPRASVAHALAATVPGFTATAATATATTTGAGAATAGKAALAKTAVTLLAVGTTAAALHTGRIHLPAFIRDLPSHHAAARLNASEDVDTSTTPSSALRPAIIALTRESQAGHPSASRADTDRAERHDPNHHAVTADPDTPTNTGAGNQDPQGNSQQNQNAGGNQNDQGGSQSNAGDGGNRSTNSGNSNSQGDSGNTSSTGSSGSSGNSNSGNTDNSGNASGSGNTQ
jgi:RNA polymerase sigma-70 factor (ECF subfamily)